MAFNVHTVLGFISLRCSLTCRKMPRISALGGGANDGLNADDQPDKEWLFLDLHQLEDKLCRWQHMLHSPKQGHGDRLRLIVERLEKFVERLRQPGSKQWLCQVRVGVA